MFMNKKWKLYLSIIVGLLLLLPLIVNSLYLFNSWHQIFEEPSKWSIFWATYLSSIASFAMVFITWKTLRQNKEQLDELKRQWAEQHKPLLRLTVDNYGIHCYLKVQNVGTSHVKNIKVMVDAESANNFDSVIIVHDELRENNWVLTDNLSLYPQESYSFALFHATGGMDFRDLKVFVEIAGEKREHVIDIHNIMLDALNHKL